MGIRKCHFHLLPAQLCWHYDNLMTLDFPNIHPSPHEEIFDSPISSSPPMAKSFSPTMLSLQSPHPRFRTFYLPTSHLILKFLFLDSTSSPPLEDSGAAGWPSWISTEKNTLHLWNYYQSSRASSCHHRDWCSPPLLLLSSWYLYNSTQEWQTPAPLVSGDELYRLSNPYRSHFVYLHMGSPQPTSLHLLVKIPSLYAVSCSIWHRLCLQAYLQKWIGLLLYPHLDSWISTCCPCSLAADLLVDFGILPLWMGIGCSF